MNKGQSTISNKPYWLILLLLIFVPRLLSLDRFLTADEPLFLEQARQFADGLAGGDLRQTLGIGYPGVTLAWWSGPVVGLASTELGAYVAGRIATGLVTGFLLLLLGRLAGQLMGRWPAFIGVALLALDPYSLAYNRLLHIAAPLALFMTLAGLSFLLWLEKERARWLLLAGLFTGLALLTKSTALLLGPIFGVGLIGWGVTAGRWRQSGWWLKQLVGLLAVGVMAVVVFLVLWPAMWVDPAGAVGLTFGKLFTDQEAGTGNLGFFWLGHFVDDPGPAFYPVAFLLKATPWLLVGLLLSLYSLLRPSFALRRRPGPVRNISVALWLFALTYLVVMTIASKKSVRYMLPAFPAFYLLAGLAFYETGQIVRQQLDRWQHNRQSAGSNRLAAFLSPPFLPVLLFLVVIGTTLFYHPYYFTYYNPFLLGWRWAPQTLLVGWGEGLDQAARYLNRQPQQQPVSAWYKHLFQIFYDGPVQDVMTEDLLTADQAVLYVNQLQRDIPNPNIIHYFRTRRRPAYTVRLAGIDYAWVYSGPVAGFRPDPRPDYALGGDFGGEARLLGYDLHPTALSGRPLFVTLYWRALATPPADRFVYLRLVDEQGRVWARADSPPVMGLWPTRRWQPDMLVEDAHQLAIPPGTPPGTYRLEAGLYDPDSGQPLPATGQPPGRGGGLLLGEVPLAWQPAQQTNVDLLHQTEARLAPNARLIGYDLPAAAATTGDLLPVHLAWRESGTIFPVARQPNNLVLFQWRQNGQPRADQLEPLPFPIEKWGRRAVLLSQHDVIVPPTLGTGQYELAVMLHDGSDPAGRAFGLGIVEVVAPPRRFDLPAGALPPAGPAHLEQTITLAGYRMNLTGPALDIDLYWRLETPVTTRYKIFVQLLAADNTLVAQSDSFPAGDRRATTGWLPEEIITDSHSLSLPPDLASGHYRLIAGLYDPVSGQRLPVLNESGDPVADAVLVAEVTLP